STRGLPTRSTGRSSAGSRAAPPGQRGSSCEQRRRECLQPRGGPVPARHVDLVPLALDGFEGAAGDERRVRDERRERKREASALREARRVDKGGEDREPGDPAPSPRD